MASTADDSSVADTASSLGDSSYDFVDDRSTTTEDDDVSNLAQSIHSTDEDVHEADAVSPDVIEPLKESCETSKDAQEHTTSNDDRGGACTPSSEPSEDQSASEIELDEQPIDPSLQQSPQTGGLRTRGSHVLGSYTSSSLPKACAVAYGSQTPIEDESTISAKVQLVMSEYQTVPKASYRILYIGDASAKDTILQKLGSTLIIGFDQGETSLIQQHSSRYNVVPISSFGASQSRDVMLVDSVGLEMTVEECKSAYSTKTSIALVLSNGKTVSRPACVLSRSDRRSCDWEDPELAVFYISAHDSPDAKRTRSLAYRFMTLSHIPCIIISGPEWSVQDLEPGTSPFLGMPHICLESANGESGDSQTRRLPLDLQQFLSLRESQLNRNLAHQAVMKRVRAYRKSCSAKQKSDGSLWMKLRFSEDDTPITYLQRNIGFVKIFVLIETLAFAALLGLLYSIQVGEQPLDDVSPIASTLTQTAYTSALARSRQDVAPSSSSVLSIQSSSTIASKKPLPEIKSISPSSTDLAALLFEPSTFKPNASVKFLVHVVGDRHIIIRPPLWFTQRRLSPRVQFQITRQKSLVDHEVSTLLDGIYSVKIPKNEGYGKMNISIRTSSKPRVKEEFEVDFGNPWLRSGSMKRAADAIKKSISQDLILFQGEISTMYLSTSRELQNFVQDTTTLAHRMGEGLSELRARSLNTTVRSSELIAYQSRELALTVARGLGRPSKQLKQALGSFEKKSRHQNQQLQKAVARYTRSMHALIPRNLHKSTEQMLSKVQKSHKMHVRNTQKRLLKSWWKATKPRRQKEQQPQCTKRRRFARSKKVRCS